MLTYEAAVRLTEVLACFSKGSEAEWHAQETADTVSIVAVLPVHNLFALGQHVGGGFDRDPVITIGADGMAEAEWVFGR